MNYEQLGTICLPRGTRKTIDRYLKSNEEELRKNGYEIFTGKRLKEAKEQFKRGISVPLYEEENGLLKAKSNLGLFDFRSFLNLGMLLKESEKLNRQLKQIKAIKQGKREFINDIIINKQTNE